MKTRPCLSFLTTILALATPIIHGWTFTTVLPSPGNPKNKLNRRVVEELERLPSTSNLVEVSNGKLQFDWHEEKEEASKFAQWLGKRGIRSLRLVVCQGRVELVEEDCQESITRQVLEGIKANRATTLEAWHSFGNACNEADSFSVYVSCQKLHSTPPNDLYDKLSTTQMASQIVRDCQEHFQWIPQPKKRKANLRLQVVLSSTPFCIDIRVELVTLMMPTDQRANQELPHPGMKRIESWAVAKSADIRPHHTVLDPMCGKGSFLMEAATFYQPRSIVGVDCDPQQLECARINRQAMGLQDAIELIQGDSRDLAQHIQSHSIDRIICCPPFGRQFSREEFEEQKGSLLDFYRELLREWNRVLVPRTGRMVLMIDQGNLEDLTNAIRLETDCTVTCERRFRLGKLQGVIVVADAAGDCGVPNRELSWEKGGSGKNTRALWTQMRAAELPSLVPVSPQSSSPQE